ncbi:MAG: hypothetical protein ACRC46_13835, partial [Thermoguttaceae bacterium]
APYDTIYGAIAYIRADDSIVEYAQSRGIFTVLATGKSAKIVNAKEFQPHKWGTLTESEQEL